MRRSRRTSWRASSAVSRSSSPWSPTVRRRWKAALGPAAARRRVGRHGRAGKEPGADHPGLAAVPRRATTGSARSAVSASRSGPGGVEVELDEAELHEALLNVAFDGGPPWRLLCPYDVKALPGDVVDEVARTHPVVHRPLASPRATAATPTAANGSRRPLPAAPDDALPSRSGDRPGRHPGAGAAAVPERPARRRHGRRPGPRHARAGDEQRPARRWSWRGPGLAAARRRGRAGRRRGPDRRPARRPGPGGPAVRERSRGSGWPTSSATWCRSAPVASARRSGCTPGCEPAGPGSTAAGGHDVRR